MDNIINFEAFKKKIAEERQKVIENIEVTDREVAMAYLKIMEESKKAFDGFRRDGHLLLTARIKTFIDLNEEQLLKEARAVLGKDYPDKHFNQRYLDLIEELAKAYSEINNRHIEEILAMITKYQDKFDELKE
jgi:hypothetical protein